MAHAGAAFSTLGGSRVEPTSGWWNSVGVTGAIIGMVTMTLAVSYILNILSTVSQGRALAMHANLLCETLAEPQAAQLDDLADELTRVTVALKGSPLAAYFDTANDLQSLPKALLALVDRLGHASPTADDVSLPLARIEAALARLNGHHNRPYDGDPHENARRWSVAHRIPRTG